MGRAEQASLNFHDGSDPFLCFTILHNCGIVMGEIIHTTAFHAVSSDTSESYGLLDCLKLIEAVVTGLGGWISFLDGRNALIQEIAYGSAFLTLHSAGKPQMRETALGAHKFMGIAR